jgi:hypothetical protein
MLQHVIGGQTRRDDLNTPFTNDTVSQARIPEHGAGREHFLVNCHRNAQDTYFQDAFDDWAVLGRSLTTGDQSVRIKDQFKHDFSFHCAL